MKSDDIFRSNKEIYRYLMNGGILGRAPGLACFLSEKMLERVKEPAGRYGFHHLRVKSGNSVLRSGRMPWDIMKNIDLSRRENQDYLIDMMGTVPVLNSEHKALHADLTYQNSDIFSFPYSKWPWFMRTEDNYNKAASALGVNMSYEAFMLLQANAPEEAKIRLFGPEKKAAGEEREGLADTPEYQHREKGPPSAWSGWFVALGLAGAVLAIVNMNNPGQKNAAKNSRWVENYSCTSKNGAKRGFGKSSGDGKYVFFQYKPGGRSYKFNMSKCRAL